MYSNMFSEPLFVEEDKKEEAEVIEEESAKPNTPNPIVFFDITVGGG